MGPFLSKNEPNNGNTNIPPSTRPARVRTRAGLTNECIIEQDKREVVEVEKTVQFIGLIRGKFKSNPALHIGTGAIISDDLILTAAHNVCKFNNNYNKYKQYLQSTFASNVDLTSNSQSLSSPQQTIQKFKHVQYAQWIQFYPVVNGKLEGLNSTEILYKRNLKGVYPQVKQYKVHPFYITDIDNRRFDICLLHLKAPLPNVKRIKLLENYTNTNTEISVYGYPWDRCFQKQEASIRQLGATGSYKLDQENGYINYKIATQTGQSGSPIFINTTKNGVTEYFCIGIHICGNKSLGTNIGIHLNEEKLDFLAKSVESMTGKISKLTQVKFPKLPENNTPIDTQKNVHQRSLEDYEKDILKAEESPLSTASTPKKTIYLYRQAAFIYLIRQKYTNAIRYYETFVKLIEALPEVSRNEDDEHEYEAALINLAKCHCQQGNYELSLSLYQKVEAKCREFLNLSVEKESTILNNKGAVLVHLQRFQEALDFFQRSYKLRRSRLGEENLLTYNSLENVTSMKSKLGLGGEENIKTYERVRLFKEKKYGIGSREAIWTCINLADAQFYAKQYDASLNNFYYCFQKLKLLRNNKDYENFQKKFKTYMRELCKIDCSKNIIKTASQLCEKQNLNDLQKELQEEWEKRNATQTN